TRGRLEPWDPPVQVVTPPAGARPGSSSSSSSPAPTKLSQLKGWWNGVATGDFDGDGRQDILAANWGRNTKYEAFRAQPLRARFGEWTFPGIVDVFETYYDPSLKKEVPWCAYRVAKLLPWVTERFPTQTAFSTAGIAEILGDRMATGQVVE